MRASVEILFGVSAKQCRDHFRKSFPPPNFEFSPKTVSNPKVEFAKSRSRFGEYIRWSDITKVLYYRIKRLFWRFCWGVYVTVSSSSPPVPPTSPQKANPESEVRVCKLNKSNLRLHKIILNDESAVNTE